MNINIVAVFLTGFIGVGSAFLVTRIQMAGKKKVLAGLRQAAGRFVAGDTATSVEVPEDQEYAVIAEALNTMALQVTELRKCLLAQTLYAGMAEVSSDTLHNVRNAMVPLFTNADGIKVKLKEIDLSTLAIVGEELSQPGLPEDRKEKLIRYLVLSQKKMADQLTKIKESTDKLKLATARINDCIYMPDKLIQHSGVIEEFFLQSMFDDSLGLIRKELLVGISIRFSPGVAGVGRVENQKIVLLQICSKCIKNAVESIRKTFSEGGEIDINAELEVDQGRDVVHLTIRDNGSGIAPENLEKIFFSDYSTKKILRGGKGLHWCSNSIKALQGRIYAWSKGIDQGAELHILFPKKFY